MQSFAPAVGPNTAILPLLNGMRHLDLLEQRFGAGAVLGGCCAISATLDPEGRVLHLGPAQTLSFGERDGTPTERVQTIASVFAGVKFEARASDVILQEMWEKWVFIATAAGITCLMRATVGDVVVAGAADLAISLLDECATIAGRQGFPPSPAAMQRNRAMFTAADSGFAASMLRDVEQNARTEVEHVLGDLLRRGDNKASAHALLRIAYANLMAYEARRARTRGASFGNRGQPSA
jgi:2-dehydropantoate 2-reductase